MKKCPTCDKTFDDALRFCQIDGTPLVDAAEPVDPYKTMVARPEDIAAAIPPMTPPEKIEPAASVEEEVLEIPAVMPDPKKTMYASEDEIRNAMAEVSFPDEPVIDVPPMAEPAPPQFIEPSLSPSEPANQPPPSPFVQPEPESFSQTTPPIPSPFDAPKQKFEVPEPPAFVQPEPEPFNPPASDFGSPMVKSTETPSPVAQESDWQDQQMQNPQFQNPAAAGPSQTLAIISLVVGILSLLCCWWFVPGIVGLVLGFVARSKANSDPANYGGAGLALGGIICGALSLILGVIIIVLYFLGFAASMMGNMR